MNCPTRMIRKTIVITSIFATGVITGALFAGGFVGRDLLRAQVDLDTSAAFEASNVLASLRTGDAAHAERILEQTIDGGLSLTAFQTSSGKSWFSRLSAQQLDQLAAVKYYRKAFPTTRPNSAEVLQLMAAVPDISVEPNATCTSGFCRIAREKIASGQPLEIQISGH